MSLVLRVFLILASLVSIIYVIRKIRKAKLKIDYSIFWIIMSFVIIVLSIFPQIIIFLAGIIGIESPVNLLFLIMIFILLFHGFKTTLKISVLETKINNLTEEIAIREKMRNDKMEGDKIE